MVVRVDVSRELLVWARERARLTVEDLVHRCPKLADWEAGESRPTLKQLEDFALATHAPVGYLLLSAPPEESIPIPDFRTMGDVGVQRPSPDLLETVYQCQQRQEWYHDFVQINGDEPRAFVGSLAAATDVQQAAEVMRDALDFSVAARGGTWSEALRRLAENADQLGVLVMVNGVVGSNTHRKLDPKEFRGFALVDDRAPLVFVNGADTKAAQIFTLAHELAHVWVGATALSDADLGSAPTNEVEQWCNQVAAELLVPLEDLRGQIHDAADPAGDLERLAARFRVSTLVVLRRIHDGGYIDRNAYRLAYRAELARILAIVGENPSSGGNFYNTQPVRVSKRFARAIIASTLEGQTLYRDAFQMLGFKKHSTFEELAQRLGVV